MKRIPSLLLTAALLLTAVGCERYPSAPGRDVRFLAERIGTRTAFTQPDGTSYPVVWTEADEAVKVVLNSGSPADARVQAADDGQTARFTASFSDDGTGSYTFQALSPASAFLGIEEGRWAFGIPAEQTASAASVDPAAMVLSASRTFTEWPREVRLSFEHLSAYGRLSLSGGPVTGLRSVTLSFEGEETVTVHTSAPESVWFGIKPFDASGKELSVTVRSGHGTYTKSVRIPEGRRFEAGKIALFHIDLSDARFEPASPSISILAIGNSFSRDAMAYLYGYLRQAGYTDIFLGNLYIGGCSLETHAGNLTRDAAAYEYFTNSGGSWSSVTGKSILSALKSRAWDYVSMQQASGWSGIPDSYEPHLSTIVEAVKANCPGARLMWHQTWAYQKDSNHSDFAKYGNDQTRMYEAILDAVRTKVVARGDFDLIIPCGTAIQNLRTSFIGDHLTRDGYHMTYQVGRVATALTWLKQISACPLDGIAIRPSDQTLSETQTAAIKDAVAKACAQPFAITPSALTVGNAQPDTEILAQFEAAGYDPSKYKPLPLDLVSYAYYNSTSGSTLVSRMAGSTASNLDQFAATTGVFSKEDIPAGSVIVLKPGYQYRPEGWKSLDSKNASSARPSNVTATIVPVTSGWWGSWKYRAFNLAEYRNPALTEEGMQELMHSFAIFVPIQ